MSRIGKKPIDIPQGVSIEIKNERIFIKGKHGSFQRDLSSILECLLENNKLILKRIDDSKKSREYHGLMRALIQNMITGVDKEFSRVLVAEGVGYKFQVEKSNLIVNVGYSHPIEFTIPSDLKIKLESNTKISITGIDKERVGFFASQVRATRPPEPYKGKGILYEGEKIIRKAGKTGK